MSKQKACKNCKTIYSGVKCPKCGSEDSSDSFKGKVVIFNPEQSEVAKNLNLKEKGEYAIKV
ncbi:DNA-directed RNA polymerase subunit E'' [Candidatus Pacearchaeota archaeon]|nr:DNA-directed RNA polymerase subunit E'' [Candidatus Pacearchaeota archaeon]